MTDLSPSDLRDPQPPTPGERERALVATRAQQLGRRRHLVQGAGALALVAAVAVSVAALTAGGASGPGRTSRVEAASTGSDTTTSAPTTLAPTTTPTTVADTVPVAPAPTSDTTAPVEAPAVETPPVETPAVEPVAPATFTLSGTVTGNPADTTVRLLIAGPGGERSVDADAAGNYVFPGLLAGEYSVRGQWVDSSGTATAARRLGTAVLPDNPVMNFTFP